MKVYAYNNRIVYANYNRGRCTSLKHMLIVKTKNDIVPERIKAYKTILLSLLEGSGVICNASIYP